MIKIKFIPTGLEFEVEKAYGEELLRDEPQNFISVDGYKLEEKPSEPTVYESIVVEEEATETETETEPTEETVEEEATETETETEPTEETVEEEATEVATSNTNNKNKKK